MSGVSTAGERRTPPIALEVTHEARPLSPWRSDRRLRPRGLPARCDPPCPPATLTSRSGSPRSTRRGRAMCPARWQISSRPSPTGRRSSCAAGGTYRMEQGFRIAGRLQPDHSRQRRHLRGHLDGRLDAGQRAHRGQQRHLGLQPACGRGQSDGRGQGQHLSSRACRTARLRHQPLNQRAAQRCHRHRHLRRLRVHGSLGWRRVHGRSAHRGQHLRSQRSAGHHR